MYKAVYRSIIKRREGLFFLICSVFPILTSLISLFQSGLKSMVGSSQLSCFDYMALMVKVQWQFGIPTLLLAYLVTAVFSSEIQSGTLFLYKDIDKKSIFHAKLLGLVRVLLAFFFLTVGASLISYYTVMLKHDYISGRLFPTESLDLQSGVVSILSSLLTYAIVIVLVAYLACQSGTVQAILGGMFFMILSNVSTELSYGRFLFPAGYMVVNFPFYLKMILILFSAGIYLLIFYLLAVRSFKKVEF